MSTPTAMPVPFIHHEPITKAIIDNVGSKSSYVKMLNGRVVMVMLPAGDAVVVPSAYEKPLHVLSYRFELQKCTIPKVAQSKHVCKALLQDLLYLDRVRDTLIQEVRLVPDTGLQHWRCIAFEYHLWLDYMYGKHDDEARKLLESQHGVTFEAIRLKKSGTDILKILDWAMYKRRYCDKIDFCGFGYPLESTIGKEQPPAAMMWAQLILAGASSDDDGVVTVVQGNTRADMRDIEVHERKRQKRNEEKRQDKGKQKMEVVIETEAAVNRQKNIRQSDNGTCSALEMAIKNLKILLLEHSHTPPIVSGIHGDEKRDEYMGLCLFMNALENYAEEPNLMDDFFCLAGAAARAREHIQQAQFPVSVVPVHTAEDSGAVRQPSSSKRLQKPPTTTMPEEHASEFSAISPISHTSRFEHEGLLKAWRKYTYTYTTKKP
ncbi:hypothetical protein J3R83DRAFT_10138 [Lanmaoa asiatica]|nr:hypothetical protein J3R83DRAFT_10138 [Lanmaoa asiatica]